MSTVVKRCSRCGEEKATDQFSKGSRYKDGKQPWCKPCVKAYHADRVKARTPEERAALAEKRRQYVAANPERVLKTRATWQENVVDVAAYMREWRKKNIGKQREYSLRSKYGLDPEVYQWILIVQGDECAIPGCSNTPEHVDHDHSCCPGRSTCGKCMRGILCRRCNLTLGSVKDNQELLAGMIYYLQNAPLHVREGNWENLNS